MIEIGDVSSTDLFVGTEERPLQLHRVTLRRGAGESLRAGQPVVVLVEGVGVGTPDRVEVSGLRPGEERVVDVPVAVDPHLAEGTRQPVTVLARQGDRSVRRETELVVAAPGWTVFLVPHFHYDPFWWNTQAGFLDTWDEQPQIAQDHRKPGQAAAFELVRSHLDLARRDPDYKFVLAELDYLRPYWDLYPQDRDEVRRLIASGRLELVGGMYNEPNTNLTSLESTIRNAMFGIRYHRDMVGMDPRTGWLLDVFGHDPALPAVLADAGLTASAFARGPFHKWGPELSAGGTTGMQFPTEFEWIGPDGRGLLSTYLAHHYPAGWRLNDLETLADAEEEVYAQFQALKRVAATRNVLLPVGYNHVIPAKWTTEIHRSWNKRYVWPRFVCGLPGEFFARVRDEADRRGLTFSPQSRDMNPVYTGKDVSYIDIKQGQRAAEVAVTEGEKLATLASLLGARYPAEALDKAWRQLCFGAHHDGITGVMSDQVYLDLLGGWREAYELGTGVRREALACLLGRVDTRGDGRPLVVVNTHAWGRTDLVSVTAGFAHPGTGGVTVTDDAGNEVPAVATAMSRHPDGTLASITLAFVAADVPATGYRTYRLRERTGPDVSGWRPVPGRRIESESLLVVADPARGGALSRVYDKRTGKDLLRPGEVAGEVVCDDEYPEHPEFRKGPWHIIPRGTRRSTGSQPADVRVEVSPAGQRLVVTGRLDDFDVVTEITLWRGLDRLEFRTRVDAFAAQERLLRVRFPLDIAGALPVYEVGNAVVGRTFGHTQLDVAEHPFVLDNPAYTWVGLSATARIALRDGTTSRGAQAIGVAEVVAEHGAGGPADDVLRGLVAALVQQGVTATTSRPDGSRCGSLTLDSNLPDIRLAIGGPETNAFTARVLAAAGERYADRLRELIATTGTARLWVPAARGRRETWVPGADVRGDQALPVLVVAGRDDRATAGAVAELVADLADSTIEVDQPAGVDGADPVESLESYSAALLNRGTPGAVVEPDGTLYLSLMRSCSEWPSGIWIDPPRRAAPDGSSFALQHWTHTFEYALVWGPGDWRDAGLVRAGHAYNSRLHAEVTETHQGELPASASLLQVDADNVVVTALKRRETGLPAGLPTHLENGITVRCFEAHGRPTRATLSCFRPLREGAMSNLREETGPPLEEAAGGGVVVDLGPAATVTLTAVPDPAGTGAEPAELGPRREAAQPVYARYWLHDKGAAPLGDQPVMVHVEPQVVDLTGPTTVTVTVSTTGPAAGEVELVIPAGVTATPTGGLCYDLDDGHRRFEVRVTPREDAVPGVRHLAARVHGEHGQVVEDVTALWIGPGEDRSGPLDVRVETPALDVVPGRPAELRVQLTNPCRAEVHGEAQLISPYGTWELLGPWTQAFSVPPGGLVEVRFPVRVPPATPPMEVWALVKVMAFGTVHYTPSVPIVVREPAPASEQTE
ncbi:glycoside hydrolase family 38 C-terminal domain-containing protein [Micromonospora sp. NPDC048999]|uniref:glycoside hydrolase family 38 N-terminal domain-containing protein n=1 Tax=Micromonospora sp. NPDC048999 TaxID=3155391 RepID=UPI00340F0D10